MRRTAMLLVLIIIIGFAPLAGCVYMGDHIPMSPNETWTDSTHGISFGRKSFNEKFIGKLTTETDEIEIEAYFTMGGTIAIRHIAPGNSVGELIMEGDCKYNDKDDQAIMTVLPKYDKENIFGGKKTVLTFSHYVEPSEANEAP